MTTSSPLPPPVHAAPGPSPRASETKKHLRGSNLLLFGRLISLATNFLVGILTVRYLSKSDYGAFSYALGIGMAAANVVLVGMPRAISRFVPIFQERREWGALYGSLALAMGLVTTLGALGLALALLFHARLVDPFVQDPLAQSLLLVLIAIAPLQALDNLLQAVLAIFAGSRALFFRRFVLGPLLRLVAVVAVVASGGGVRFLAWAYLAASLVGVLLYGPMLRRALAKADLLAHFSWRALRLPWRELLAFGLPLVVAEVMMVVRQPLTGVLLEYQQGTLGVADLNAFAKISGLNLIVLQSMKLLFLPVASRLYAREEHAAIDDLYWQTTIWISVMTFPVFVPCIAMAPTLAGIVYGDDYVATSGVLTVLALGEFANAALGLNTYTLQVYGRVRYLFWTTLLATLTGFGVSWFLIPAHGALGAAAGITCGLVLQNVLHHVGLQRFTEVELLRAKYLWVYASLALVLALLWGLDLALDPPVWLEAGLVAGSGLFLLRLHRRTMNILSVFPELAKLPALGRFLAH